MIIAPAPASRVVQRTVTSQASPTGSVEDVTAAVGSAVESGVVAMDETQDSRNGSLVSTQVASRHALTETDRAPASLRRVDLWGLVRPGADRGSRRPI
jgi:hypothetical protein